MRLLCILLPRILLLQLALLLASCSTVSSVNSFLFPPGVKPDWDSLSLYVDPAANRDFPMAVDIVLVSDEALAKRIAAMKAADWFAARDGLRKMPGGELDIVSVELPPGESLTLPGKRFSGRRVFAALAFADYFSGGEQSARLETLTGKISIEFGAADFTVHAKGK
ncbi:MAG: hypothetical protein NBV65_02025 [Burkholderiaceae bacterium]|nr:hypothetical protein [Burkholderiaceae bacterium]